MRGVRPATPADVDPLFDDLSDPNSAELDDADALRDALKRTLPHPDVVCIDSGCGLAFFALIDKGAARRTSFVASKQWFKHVRNTLILKRYLGVKRLEAPEKPIECLTTATGADRWFMALGGVPVSDTPEGRLFRLV